MKKYIACFFIVMGMIAGVLPAAGGGFLKAKGKVIVDGSGKTFILRGMGLGGWMLQEGYMFRVGSIGRQYRIRQKIQDLIGAEKTARFYDAWLNNHTTKRDIDSLAAWGFNSIRLPMHYNLYTLPVEAEPIAGQNTWLKKGFEMTDSLLAWCRANGMYLILDLHAAPGGQGNDLNISDRDPAKPSLWESPANQQKMIALWRKLAERYAQDPAIGGYDIINEPNWGFEDPKDIRGTKEKTNKPLRELMMQITAAIREVDKVHIIIIEGNGFGNNYNGIFPLWDNNLVLSFHKYGNYNTQGSIQNFLDWQDKYNVPLWLGESGENSNTWFTEAIRLVEARNIGWCWWQLKKMGINNPLEIKLTPSYQRLLNYWLKGGPQPSADEAEAALNELLENVKIQNTIYHKDVTDALFRQVATLNTLPFKDHVINDGAIINAVDFDLGRQGYAYKDNDTARYQYAAPSAPSAGNRGGAYRNDGVDIQGDSLLQEGQRTFHVSNIEDGEWLQYTATVAKAGAYTVVFTVSATDSGGIFSFFDKDKLLVSNIVIHNTGGLTNWQTVEIKNLVLSEGVHPWRVVAVKGGFNFSRMQFVASQTQPHFELKNGKYQLTMEGASHFAELPLRCMQREFPYKTGVAFPDSSLAVKPKLYHPAFYGCFDWHSSVHGHWMLVRLLKLFPDMPRSEEIRQKLEENLAPENIKGEMKIFAMNDNKSFERTYGWAWLLQLQTELLKWDDPLGRKLSASVAPLAQQIAGLFVEYLPKMSYPVRVGEHPNLSFALRLAWDYAVQTKDETLRQSIVGTALRFYKNDVNYPISWEPGGNDFLSPALEEADLMWRILPDTTYQHWLRKFLPALTTRGFKLEPGEVKDRTDGKLVHLDGLNLSRAWDLYGIARHFPANRSRLYEIANRHLREALPNVASGDYMGEHWLASFAVYSLTMQ